MRGTLGRPIDRPLARTRRWPAGCRGDSAAGPAARPAGVRVRDHIDAADGLLDRRPARFQCSRIDQPGGDPFYGKSTLVARDGRVRELRSVANVASASYEMGLPLVTQRHYLDCVATPDTAIVRGSKRWRTTTASRVRSTSSDNTAEAAQNRRLSSRC